MKLSLYLIFAIITAGCSAIGPGFTNHPVDCAAGINWDDCLPGTPGYNNRNSQKMMWEVIYENGTVMNPTFNTLEECQLESKKYPKSSCLAFPKP
ncbi:hypothetical protein G6734_00070 [Polynucleobacter paneuropaeus]|nr:hypothetical protein [Polynucleobacter paneuropaeus]